MIPSFITDYLKERDVPFVRHPHRRAVSAQEVAASLHVTGYRVAKTVVVEAAGRRYLAVLPAAEMLDTDRFAEAVGSPSARLLSEREFEGLFAGCEVGAEPPFGTLFALPVVLDASMAREPSLVLRAGSHEETLELSAEDFLRLERPLVAALAAEHGFAPRATSPEPHP